MKYSDWGSIYASIYVHYIYSIYIYIFVCMCSCMFIDRCVLGTTIIIIITCHAKNFDQSTATVACYGGFAIRTLARRITRKILIVVLYNIIAIFFLPITLYTQRYAGRFSYSRIRITYRPYRSLLGKKKIVDDRSIFPRPRHCEQSGS